LDGAPHWLQYLVFGAGAEATTAAPQYLQNLAWSAISCWQLLQLRAIAQASLNRFAYYRLRGSFGKGEKSDRVRFHTATWQEKKTDPDLRVR